MRGEGVLSGRKSQAQSWGGLGVGVGKADTGKWVFALFFCCCCCFGGFFCLFFSFKIKTKRKALRQVSDLSCPGYLDWVPTLLSGGICVTLGKLHHTSGPHFPYL